MVTLGALAIRDPGRHQTQRAHYSRARDRRARRRASPVPKPTAPAERGPATPKLPPRALRSPATPTLLHPHSRLDARKLSTTPHSSGGDGGPGPLHSPGSACCARPRAKRAAAWVRGGAAQRCATCARSGGPSCWAPFSTPAGRPAAGGGRVASSSRMQGYVGS